jgi:hypothetical protein
MEKTIIPSKTKIKTKKTNIRKKEIKKNRQFKRKKQKKPAKTLIFFKKKIGTVILIVDYSWLRHIL